MKWCTVCGKEKHSYKHCRVCKGDACKECIYDDKCLVCHRIYLKRVSRKEIREYLESFDFSEGGPYDRILDEFIDILIFQNPDDLDLRVKVYKALQYTFNYPDGFKKELDNKFKDRSL